MSGDDFFVKLGASIVVLGVVLLLTLKLEKPQPGVLDLKYHIIYWVVAGLLIGLLPVHISGIIFSELTLVLVGSVIPVYESVLAVCTPDEDDDTDWLRYWTVGGIFFMVTGWVDELTDDIGDTYWYKAAIFFLFWLYFPKTNGAYWIDEKINQKYLGPRIKPLQAKLTNIIEGTIQLLSSAVHLYLLWIFFLFLPKEVKKFVAIAVGVVYPFISSVVAIATEELEDDTYWLTYWSCYGVLFLFIEVTETYLGPIPGYYTALIFLEVYLMVPMFGGAEKVFRKFLVPLFGQQEMLMLRDAFLVNKRIFKDLKPERAAVVRQTISNYFKYSHDDHDGSKKAFMLSCRQLEIPEKKEPTETTSLV